MSDFIMSSFYQKMANVKFDAYGIIDSTNKIHTLGTDSKLLAEFSKCSLNQFLNKLLLRMGIF